MSFAVVAPELMRVAASDLANIGSTLSAANAVAAAQTTAVQAAAADEVSTAIAALFGWHAQTYQSLSAQATSFHDQFVQTVASSGTSYWSAEATNVEQTLLNAINAPTEALFGRPLIGDGADGQTVNGVGQAGGDGGFLWGNGGNGGDSTSAGVAGGAGGSAGLFGNGG
ncbi:PE family protein, partial [Mycobacterium ulcerans]